MKRQAWCAFFVEVLDRETGDTSMRYYVRGEKRMSVEAFAAWALGDMLLHIVDTSNLRYKIRPADPDEVIDNRKQGIYEEG